MRRIPLLLLSFSLWLACSEKPTNTKNLGNVDSSVTAQATVNRLFEDSLLCDSLIKALKYRLAEEQIELSEVHLTDQMVDSVLKELGIELFESSVHYAPDSSFKLLTVSYEVCGAYCSPHYEVTPFHTFNQQMKTIGAKLSQPVEQIIQLPDGKFVLLGGYTERPGSSIMYNCSYFELVEINGHSLVFHKPYETDTTLLKDSERRKLVTNLSPVCNDYVYIEGIPSLVQQGTKSTHTGICSPSFCKR